MSDLQEKVYELHRREPFVSADPRENVNRVKLHVPEIANCFVSYRGEVSIGSVCVDSVWLQNPATGAIIDPTYPIKHPDFAQVCGAWVARADSYTSDQLRTFLRTASIYEKVIDVVDKRYRGNPYWTQHKTT